jgi:hypothetical protein
MSGLIVTRFVKGELRRQERVLQSDEYVDRTAEKGRLAWAALHKQHRLTMEWLRTVWKPMIPKLCGCDDSFEEYLRDNPPSFESEESDFVWGWRFHNHVNSKLLCHPILSLQDAVQLWRPDLVVSEEM